MNRLLVLSLLAAGVLAPAAAARTITAASSSAMTPSSEGLYISQKFTPPPRSVTIVTSGPINGVRAEASCFRQKSYYQVPLSKAQDNRPGRLGVGYDHTATYCTIRATAYASSSAKPGRPFKIAIQIER